MKTKYDAPDWTRPENIRWTAWGWDHLTYYRRMGARDVPFWGNSGWLEKWWSRLHDEKTLDQIADMGVNVLITHYFLKHLSKKFPRPPTGRYGCRTAHCAIGPAHIIAGPHVSTPVIMNTS